MLLVVRVLETANVHNWTWHCTYVQLLVSPCGFIHVENSAKDKHNYKKRLFFALLNHHVIYRTKLPANMQFDMASLILPELADTRLHVDFTTCRSDTLASCL